MRLGHNVRVTPFSVSKGLACKKTDIPREGHQQGDGLRNRWYPCSVREGLRPDLDLGDLLHLFHHVVDRVDPELP
jgi:hypothetical protein